MDKLIATKQTGFIKDRYNCENTRLVYDLIKFTEEQNIDDDDDCFKVALASRHSGYPQSAIWDNL